MYTVFTRTWWKNNPSWPNSLEPHAGRKHTIARNIPTEDAARDICKVYNSNHKPGRLSKKAEYAEQ
jgi:hypothetical protein